MTTGTALLCSANHAARHILHVHPRTVGRWIRENKLLVAGKLTGETGAYLLYVADVERFQVQRKQEEIRRLRDRIDELSA